MHACEGFDVVLGSTVGAQFRRKARGEGARCIGHTPSSAELGTYVLHNIVYTCVHEKNCAIME